MVVQEGKVFKIELDGTPTAGFTWEVTITPEISRLIELLESTWEHKSEAIGGMAVQQFRFRAIAPGKITLIFRYRRPWEGTDRDQRAYTVSIEPSDRKDTENAFLNH